MTLIDGVGDEVVHFVATLMIVIVTAIAWWSTNARPDRYRTVLVMRSRTYHPVTVSIRTRNNLVLSNTQSINSTQASTSNSVGVSTSETVEESSRDNARVIPLQEMDSIVDADMAMLDNNRLHFYRRINSPTSIQSTAESTSDESETQEEPEPASNAQIREMDSIVSAMEADVTTGCDFFTRSNESNNTTLTSNVVKTVKKDEADNAASTANVNPPVEGSIVNTDNASGDSGATSNQGVAEGDKRKILIKLKYLNDTLKVVEGSLDELLKDFKWRHFSSELTSESRVRLIFNGRVLADEAATLRACGLHHRAVVHCLVHPKRVITTQHVQEQTSEVVTHEFMTERVQPDQRNWDLENTLITLVSVALTIVWFFRCEYSNMFTASASVALFGLTVFYSIAIFGLYLTDTFQIDRRPAPAAVPNN